MKDATENKGFKVLQTLEGFVGRSRRLRMVKPDCFARCFVVLFLIPALSASGADTPKGQTTATGQNVPSSGSIRYVFPGSIDEGQVGAEGSVDHSVSANAGEVVRGELEQLGLDLALQVDLPAGTSPALFDCNPTWFGRESFAFEAKISGVYILRVRAAEKCGKLAPF